MTEASESPAFEAGDPKHHFFWCKKCEAPVRSSGWRGPVVIACAACGFEERRDIHLVKRRREKAATGLYRDPAPDHGKQQRVLTVDINTAPAGYDVATIDVAKLREAIAKKNHVPEDRKAAEWRTSCEFEAAWVAVWLALQTTLAGDPLGARIALETALDATEIAEYRALLLAHLAQHAGAQKSPRLAKRWLAVCPNVTIATVESEVRAARAMLALAQKDYWEVIQLTGGNRAGTGFTGTSLFLAIALNVEASDRRGDLVVADAIMRSARKQDFMSSMVLFMSAFDLAKDGLKRLNRWVQKRDATTSSMAAAFALSAVALGWSHLSIANALGVILLGAATTYAVCWFTFVRRAFTRGERAFRIGTSCAITMGAVAVFSAALVLG